MVFWESTTGSRPLVIVSDDCENLPAIYLVVQNVGSGPAKNVSFAFSSPIESSDGYVLSELAIFQEGITSPAGYRRVEAGVNRAPFFAQSEALGSGRRTRR
jgi:hypothetical protein